MKDSSLARKKPVKHTGILLHPTALPGPYGIGDLGDSAYKFIDFLVRSGLNTWQVLPLGHTGFGDSPYQPFSAFAGQPLIISIDYLITRGLLVKKDFDDMPAWNPEQVSYGELIEFKTKLLKKAYERFTDESISDGLSSDTELMSEYNDFINNTFWLDDYALFMAVKDYHNGLPWYKWEKSIKSPRRNKKQNGSKSFQRIWDITNLSSFFSLHSGQSLRHMPMKKVYLSLEIYLYLWHGIVLTYGQTKSYSS